MLLTIALTVAAVIALDQLWAWSCHRAYLAAVREAEAHREWLASNR